MKQKLLVGTLALLFILPILAGCGIIQTESPQTLRLLVEDENEGWKSKEALILVYTKDTLKVTQGNGLNDISDGEHGATLLKVEEGNQNSEIGRPCAVNIFTTQMGKKVIQLAMGRGIYQFHCLDNVCSLYAYGTLTQVTPETKISFGDFLNK